MARDARRIRIVTTTVAASLALIAAIAPVNAASPERVHIVSHMDFNQGAFNTGDFHASGDAVENDTLCSDGTVQDTRLIFAGGQSGRKAQIPVRKTFTCDDDSGTFYVKIQVHLDFATSTETFSWVIQGGTGDYAGLSGSGQGTTVSDGSDPQTGNYNTYDGFVID